MGIEDQPKPSMRDIIEADLETRKHHGKDLPHLDLNNVPFSILFGFTEDFQREPEAVATGKKTKEQFKEDARAAISASGVDEKALVEYVKMLSQKGLAAADAQLHRKLVLPVYIKMREMGYTENDLYI